MQSANSSSSDASEDLREVLRRQLARPGTTWSIGVFGALAEFHRDPDEPAQTAEFTVATQRGAIRLEPIQQCRPVHYEWRNAKQHGRTPGVALCLPESEARIGRNVLLTELGPDRDAVRDEDRDAVLFDLGIDTKYGVFCVRTKQQDQLEMLRSGLGQRLLDSPLFNEIACMSPHRVFMSRVGRIEVYQPIGAVGGTTPEGPHTHLLPKLVKSGRTHSANALLPAGLIPCATFYES
jgi:hypothetical protein